MRTYHRMVASWGLACSLCACSNDDHGSASEAVRAGIGAECAVHADCITPGARCLTQFRGGYCGNTPCNGDADCPNGSVCVTHDDGINYCFLVCVDKIDCNLGRTPANESNCVSNVNLVDSPQKVKACVPPSGT